MIFAPISHLLTMCLNRPIVLVGTFNKEKVLVGTISGHWETSRRFMTALLGPAIVRIPAKWDRVLAGAGGGVAVGTAQPNLCGINGKQWD